MAKQELSGTITNIHKTGDGMRVTVEVKPTLLELEGDSDASQAKWLASVGVDHAIADTDKPDVRAAKLQVARTRFTLLRSGLSAAAWLKSMGVDAKVKASDDQQTVDAKVAEGLRKLQDAAIKMRGATVTVAPR